MEIRIEKTKNPKAKPDEENLAFGKIFTDHMFIMDYEEGRVGMIPGLSPLAPLRYYLLCPFSLWSGSF